jgi:hypothetical protein
VTIWNQNPSRGSCWRKLNLRRQALLVLANLRKGDTFAELAAGFGAGGCWRSATVAAEPLVTAPLVRLWGPILVWTAQM